MAEAKSIKAPSIRRLIIVLLIAVLVFLLIMGVVSITGLFNLVLLQPMLNFLILLSKYLLGNFGLAIVALTIILRIVTLPLMLRQLRSSRAIQEIQPQLMELQKKYAKDKEKLAQETMKLYKEHNINVFGCFLPMLAQFPIWIGLYQSVVQAMAYTPENLIGLSKHLYSWSVIQGMVPLNHHFLWLDLTRGDIFMAILVAGSMWLLQRMSSQPATDPTQQSMSRMMLWLMPAMFGLMALSFPSGLSLYWVLSNLISIVTQYRVTGWGTLKMPSLSALKRKPSQPVDTPAKTVKTSGGRRRSDVSGMIPQKERANANSVNPERKEAVGGDVVSQQRKGRHGKYRGKRKVRRGGGRDRPS